MNETLLIDILKYSCVQQLILLRINRSGQRLQLSGYTFSPLIWMTLVRILQAAWLTFLILLPVRIGCPCTHGGKVKMKCQPGHNKPNKHRMGNKVEISQLKRHLPISIEKLPNSFGLPEELEDTGTCDRLLLKWSQVLASLQC